MRGDPDEVRPRPDVVDDPLDRDDHAPACGQRAPDALEQRRVHDDVALAVGDERVHERDIGHERREQPDLAERSVRTVRRRRSSSIDEPAIERVTIAGNPRAAASSRCENARNDQCSTSTSPRSYAPREPRVGGEVGKSVS